MLWGTRYHIKNLTVLTKREIDKRQRDRDKWRVITNWSVVTTCNVPLDCQP